MSELTSFVVSDDTREVFCAGVGASWGYRCNDKVCEKRSYIGWDNASNVAQGAVAHLVWHLNGMPECKHCGSTLSKPRARTCPRGECSVRDGGW